MPGLLLLRIVTLIALAASAALYVDYTTAAQAFCGAGSGCAKVRGSGFGYLLNGAIPVPAIGLAGFGSVLIVSLIGEESRRKYLPPLAYIGTVAALVFIVLQAFVIQHFCWLCVTTDVAAIAAGGFAFMYQRSPGKPPQLLQTWAWSVLGLIAVCTPLFWPRLRPVAPVHPKVAAFYQPGKINVVEFADFECPFCRKLHPVLKKVAKDYPGKVNFVRLNMPLQMHPHAETAALAYLCAKSQERGEEMADALFATSDLSSKGNRRLAVGMKLDMQKFDRCMKADATMTELRKEMAILEAAGLQGLPTTYIGDRRYIGSRPEDVLRDAFEAAASGEKPTGVPGPAYAAGAFVLAGLVAFMGRRKEEDESEGESESEPESAQDRS